jgi:hypothetical protein
MHFFKCRNHVRCRFSWDADDSTDNSLLVSVELLLRGFGDVASQEEIAAAGNKASGAISGHSSSV